MAEPAELSVDKAARTMVTKKIVKTIFRIKLFTYSPLLGTMIKPGKGQCNPCTELRSWLLNL